MNEYKELLKKYKDFQECVLLGIEWKNFGLTVDFVFDYFWAKEKEKDNIDKEYPVIVRFNLIQEIHIIRDLNAQVIKNPEEVNWGINEISKISIEETEEVLSRYKNLPKPFYLAIIYWEKRRKIEIIFSDMEIIPRYLTLI